MSPQNRWQIDSRFLIRRAGFPAEILAPLRTPIAAEHARNAAKNMLKFINVKKSLLSVLSMLQLQGQGRLPVYFGIRKKIKNGLRVDNYEKLTEYVVNLEILPTLKKQIERYHALETEIRQQTGDVQKALIHEEEIAEKAADRCFMDERFQEAVFLSNPTFWEYLKKKNRPMKKRLHRRLYLYTQRFALKCDSTSFFGPTAAACFDPNQNGKIQICWSDQRPEPQVFFGHWAVRSIAMALSKLSFLRPHLTVIRKKHCIQRDRELLFVPSFFKLQIPAGTAAWLSYNEDMGGNQIQSLQFHLNGTELEMDRVLTILQRSGAIEWSLPVPDLEMHPLRLLIRELKELELTPRELAKLLPYLEILEELEQLRERFEKSNLKERQKLLRRMEKLFVSTTGCSPRRGCGVHYADRLLLFEDCIDRGLQVTVGKPIIEILNRDMAPVLEMLASIGVLQYQLESERFWQWCRNRFKCKQISLTKILFAIGDDYKFFTQGYAQCKAQLERAVEELVCELLDSQKGEVLYFEPKHIIELTKKFCERWNVDLDSCGKKLYTSPDIMMEISEQQPQKTLLVLGECHCSASLLGCFAQLHKDYFKKTGQNLYEYLTRDDHKPVQVVEKIIHKCLRSAIYMPNLMETSGQLSKGSNPLALEDIIFNLDRKEVQHRSGSESISLFSAAFFASPWPIDVLYDPFIGLERLTTALRHIQPDGSPEIRVGNCIIVRRTWRVDHNDLPVLPHNSESTMQRLIDIWTWAHKLDLPKRLFYKVKGEPKPIALDLENPLSIEVFINMVHSVGGSVWLSPMRPDVDKLWLAKGGHSYVAELRLLAYRAK